MTSLLASSPSWEATLGIVGVFFVAFPLLVNGIIGFIVAQVLGERAENQAFARGDVGSSDLRS
jgi:hypothetical protein